MPATVAKGKNGWIYTKPHQLQLLAVIKMQSSFTLHIDATSYPWKQFSQAILRLIERRVAELRFKFAFISLVNHNKTVVISDTRYLNHQQP